jgi:transcriptional regulator with XRE-family HTH domain
MAWEGVSRFIALHGYVQYAARMQAIYFGPVYSAAMTADSPLRTMRKAAGLSVRELARQIGQQATNVSYWERTGKAPRSDLLMDMARVLGVSVEEVLGLKAPRKAASPAGRLGRTFEAVAKLPRRKQLKILEVVDALVNSA